MELNLSFQAFRSAEDIERLMREGKVMILLNIATFYLKGPVRLEAVTVPDNQGAAIVAKDCYSVNELHNKMNFMTCDADTLLNSWWWSELGEQYEDTLKRLVLVRGL